MFSAILSTLAVVSFGLLVWQVFVAVRFPLHRRQPTEGFAPGITILKPLKGCDEETPECLRSWFAQDYAGPVQILFGVSSADDPVCDTVRKLIAEHPNTPAELVVCGRRLGANAKVSTLAQLEVISGHEFICVSDADVRVPSDFLANVVATFREDSAGLVSCFYQLTTAKNLPMRWEAFAVNADFWSQVLQSLSLKPMGFGLGAAMILPRRQLEAIGGFRELVDHLADDYQLGHRISQNGARIAVSPIVVECRCPPMDFREVWDHQLRWARTIRVCQGGPFFLSVLSNASFWPVLWLAAVPSMASILGGVCILATRMAAGYYLDRKLTGIGTFTSCWVAVVKDFLQLGIWFRAFTGKNVTWRGVDYRVDAEGKLIRAERGTPAPLSPARPAFRPAPDLKVRRRS